ncbi:uncharacterized protein [Lolium perenne]|uniref:uncharacterized protein n=1 Tax=Lolium perenne TaxID=4522 RepID=UPI0021EB370A|nr:uncharacterized protein LOC127342846 [Lolium perenne]XP_051224824.1 uncharacterized protein LOC127342846 [Lolium perenne]
MARDDDPPPAKRPRTDCTGTSSNDGEPPPAKRPRTDCTGTSPIDSLPGDLLREIFLRVDPLPDLVRAASACRGWRDAVVSFPPFRRHFIKRHQAPLLGFFFDPPSRDVPSIPSFAPARWNDPMLAAALLRGDFLLTSLQRRPLLVEPSWFVLDARGGYLLLIKWDEGSEGLLALLNPLEQRQRFFDVDDIRIFDDGDRLSSRHFLRGGLILDEENPDRFGIFCVASQGEFRLRAAIFSSARADAMPMDGGWILSSWLEVEHPVDPAIDGGTWLWPDSGMRAGRFIYWPYMDGRHVLVLDPTHPATPRLFVERITFPDGLDRAEFGRYIIGETRNGMMSIAYTDGFTVVLMAPLEDGWAAGTWTPVDRFDLTDELVTMLGQLPAEDELELVAMRGTILYYTTSQMYHPSHNSCWFASLCLETGQGEWLFARAYDAFVQPYNHLLWPRFLKATPKG